MNNLDLTFNEEYKIRTQCSKEKQLFCAKDICDVLGYTKHRDVTSKLRMIEKSKNKKLLMASFQMDAIGRRQKMTFLTVEGVFMLIMRSNKSEAIDFQLWLACEVLPSIKQYGCYPPPIKYVKKDNTFNIKSEFDLHKEVAYFLNKYYWDTKESLLWSVPLGEMQDTNEKRIKCKQLGFHAGAPDLIIHDTCKGYNGFCCEMKTPKGTGKLSEAQISMLERYRKRGYKILVSNDYTEIIKEIIDYSNNVHYELRKRCDKCNNTFINTKTLKNHQKTYH